MHPVRSRILFAFGLLGLVLGTLDPLDAAPLIVVAIAALALATWLRRSPERRFFLWSLPLTAVGVAIMFAISAAGGFGGDSGRSNWWGALLLPYAAGWLLSVVGCTREVVRQFTARA